MQFAIVNKATGVIENRYDSPLGVTLYQNYGGVHGNRNLYDHLQVPEGYEEDITIFFNYLNMQFEIDDDKLEEYKNLQFDDIRVRRDKLLFETDWTQLGDNTLTTVQKNAFTTYRQSLRDLPSTNKDPDLIIFPTAP